MENFIGFRIFLRYGKSEKVLDVLDRGEGENGRFRVLILQNMLNNSEI